MKKSMRIDARLPAETRQLIERAATIMGMTLTDFVVTKAHEAAVAIIREHETITLNRRDSKTFVEALLNPPEPNEALRSAAARYRREGLS